MPKRLNFNTDTPASAQRMSRSRQHSGGNDPAATAAADSCFASTGAWTANRGIRKAPMSTARPSYGAGKGVRSVLEEITGNVRRSAILEEAEEEDSHTLEPPLTPRYRSVSQPPPITPKMDHLLNSDRHEVRQQSPGSPQLRIPPPRREEAPTPLLTLTMTTTEQRSTSRTGEAVSDSLRMDGDRRQGVSSRDSELVNRSGSSNDVAAAAATSSNDVIKVNGNSYSILKKIGSGGSSVVYQVLDGERNLKAIKRVDLSEAEESEAEGYLNEVKLLEKLQGRQRIIRLFEYEYLRDSDLLFVVMERGETDLQHLLNTLGRNMGDVKRKYWWVEMLEVVQEAHSADIIHQDLKPANFLIVEGKLKLIDFGIASHLQSDKTSVIKDTRMGTFSYMSPEAIEDMGAGSGEGGAGEADDHKPRIKISKKSDVWSLGCILYMLTYGKLPFRGFKDPFKRLMAITNPDYKIPYPDEGHDALLVDVIQRCLVRDPTKRASVAELLEHPYLNKERSTPTETPQAEPKIDAAFLRSQLKDVLTPNTLTRAMKKLSSSDSNLSVPPRINFN